MAVETVIHGYRRQAGCPRHLRPDALGEKILVSAQRDEESGGTPLREDKIAVGE